MVLTDIAIMIYNSLNFLILFPLIFLGYYVIPAKYQKARNLFLLVVSYGLYLNWKPVYALVLLVVTATTYTGAILLEKNEKRKLIIWLGGALSLLPLVFFKYFNFINETVIDLLSFVGLRYELHGLNWAIPVGLSFYTFQALGYFFDVYYKRIRAEKDFMTYALFISFFPSIVAGPINKASLVIPQLRALRPFFNYAKAVEGLKMLLWGMFMKVVIADRLGLYVDTVMPNYMNYTGLTCFVASIFYSIQIYTDFAGYSLMAIGVGKTLGFELAENFRRPYFAVSVTDFWRRWHISLSFWLRDYVYIPLGGSRCSKIRNYWNIFVTFLISGIWHGANWTFIIWGVIHGFSQIIEKAVGQQKCDYCWFGKTIKIMSTFLIVNFAWIFFRMPSLKDAIYLIDRMLNYNQSLELFVGEVTGWPLIILGLMMLVINDIRDEFFPDGLRLMNSKYLVVRWLSYLVVTALIVLMGVLSSDQFIYASF